MSLTNPRSSNHSLPGNPSVTLRALIFGTADMVDGIVSRIADELGAQPTTVATGGLAPIVIPHCRSIEHHEPWLTLEGLRLVHARNADPADA